MQVKDRYGGVHSMPDRLAIQLIKLGRVSAVAVAKPQAVKGVETVAQEVEQKPKTRKSKKVE